MDPAELRRRKVELRKDAAGRRQDQPDKESLSGAIFVRLCGLPEYPIAPTVMAYVSVRDEVRTHGFIEDALRQGKRVVVPYCAGEDLELYHLENMAELAIGFYGLLEPRLELRALPGKRIDVRQVDLIVVPGVAFDRQGGRLGHGKGYYDRLLARARPDTRLVAAAFECQLVDEVPMADYDVFMDRIVTEEAVYEGRGRQ